jgi:hypothetical protein
MKESHLEVHRVLLLPQLVDPVTSTDVALDALVVLLGVKLHVSQELLEVSLLVDQVISALQQGEGVVVFEHAAQFFDL